MAGCNTCTGLSTNCADPCANTSALEVPCTSETPVTNPPYLCFEISPCNEGCVDTVGTDCVALSQNTGLFFKGQSLTSIIQSLEGMIQVLAANYNIDAVTPLVRYRFKPEQYPVTVVATRNTIQLLSATYANETDLLAALQAYETSWMLNNSVLEVAGTHDWTLTFSY